MKPQKINEYNLSTFSLDYRVWQRSEDVCFIGTTKVIATKFLSVLFGEETDKELDFNHIRELWNIGKVRAAEYAKNIIDANINGTLSFPVTAISMSMLTEQVGFIDPTDFLTERLIGKKRLQHWKNNFEGKYNIIFEDPIIYAILKMWDNKEPNLLSFIEQNRISISHIIKDYEF